MHISKIKLLHKLAWLPYDLGIKARPGGFGKLIKLNLYCANLITKGTNLLIKLLLLLLNCSNLAVEVCHVIPELLPYLLLALPHFESHRNT